jgi:hypothetical protein
VKTEPLALALDPRAVEKHRLSLVLKGMRRRWRDDSGSKEVQEQIRFERRNQGRRIQAEERAMAPW